MRSVDGIDPCVRQSTTFSTEGTLAREIARRSSMVIRRDESCRNHALKPSVADS